MFVIVLPQEDAVIRSVIHEDQPRFPTPQDRAEYEAAPLPDLRARSGPFRVSDVSIVGWTLPGTRLVPGAARSDRPCRRRDRVRRARGWDVEYWNVYVESGRSDDAPPTAR